MLRAVVLKRVTYIIHGFVIKIKKFYRVTKKVELMALITKTMIDREVWAYLRINPHRLTFVHRHRHAYAHSHNMHILAMEGINETNAYTAVKNKIQTELKLTRWWYLTVLLYISNRHFQVSDQSFPFNTTVFALSFAVFFHIIFKNIPIYFEFIGFLQKSCTCDFFFEFVCECMCSFIVIKCCSPWPRKSFDR